VNLRGKASVSELMFYILNLTAKKLMRQGIRWISHSFDRNYL